MNNKEIMFNTNKNTENNESTFKDKSVQYQYLKFVFNHSSKNSYNVEENKINTNSNQKEKINNINEKDIIQKNKELYNSDMDNFKVDNIDDDSMYCIKNEKNNFENDKKSVQVVRTMEGENLLK